MIELITHPHPWQTWLARQDHAKITGQEVAENPWWYKDSDTNMLFHGLYGCIGWPEEVQTANIGQPGYAAIIGIVRQTDIPVQVLTRDAQFLILDEVEHEDVPTLIQEVVMMRDRWGYGIRRDLLTEWSGDAERFQSTLALINERLGEYKSVWITQPEDMSGPQAFDVYVRSLRSCLQRTKQRLFYGKCEIIKDRLKSFLRNDPAILAVGGLVHTLLGQCLWMGDVSGNAGFNVEEELRV